MFEELADFIGKITKAVNSLGINLKTDKDGLHLDVAGNTITANIEEGKVKSFNVDMKGNLEEVIRKVADAVQDGCDQTSDYRVLNALPSAAETNPEMILAIGQYGHRFLFGGTAVVGVIITNEEKGNSFHGEERWTQYSPEEKLFEVVKELIGANGAPTLTELFNRKTEDGIVYSSINTDWCKIRIANHYPININQNAVEFATVPSTNRIINELTAEVRGKVGLVVGVNEDTRNELILGKYAIPIKELYDNKDSNRFASFDVKRSGPHKTTCRELRLAEAIARVVYSTQLAYLMNEYQCSLIDGSPDETIVRKHYDRLFADMDYDTKEKLVKLHMVTWDKAE